MKYLFLAMLLALGACDDNDNKSSPVNSSNWQIGPVINGTNYSKGLPTKAKVEPGAVISFPISQTAEPHYVTIPTGSLATKKEIKATFKIEGSPTALIYGAGCPETSVSALTLYFQRKDDDWQKNGWRWWYRPSRVTLAGVGTYEIVAPLDSPKWTSVMGMKAETSPEVFNAAKREAYLVGFTFANCTGAGHGAKATEPVKFTLLSWRVE